MENISIEKATTGDAKAISEIVASVLLSNLSSKDNGFLVYHGDERYYRNLLGKTEFAYIARLGRTNVGFLLAYGNDHLDEKDFIQKYLKEKYSQTPFLYIFQVAIDPRFQKKRIGTKLYERLFADAKGIKKIAITSKEPHNQASEKFHLKLGFRKIEAIDRDGGESSFVYDFQEDK